MPSSSNQYGATAAPPPTPSTQPNLFSSSDAVDSLSRLLHRQLPPILSPPSRRKSPTAITPTPTISLLDPQPSLTSNLLSASQLGFFQLTDHNIPSQLPHSADSESLSLFRLHSNDKKLAFPQNWPLGYDGDQEDDDDDEESGEGESFCIDSSCSTESADLSLTSLREFTRQMEKIGLAIIEALSSAVGFVNPVQADSSRVNSLMWISEEDMARNKMVSPGKIYPYIVGLHYQIRCRKLSLLSDSGWVSVSPDVDSILVTLGDIAQVWSNGKVKKVRGRPVPSGNNPSQSISMSLLVTLPLDSKVSPLLLPTRAIVGDEREIKQDEEEYHNNRILEEAEESSVFNSFSFEDYAWRVYHERLIFKDPLDRYRA